MAQNFEMFLPLPYSAVSAGSSTPLRYFHPVGARPLTIPAPALSGTVLSKAAAGSSTFTVISTFPATLSAGETLDVAKPVGVLTLASFVQDGLDDPALTARVGSLEVGFNAAQIEASQDIVGAMVTAAGGAYNDTTGGITLPSSGGTTLGTLVAASPLEWAASPGYPVNTYVARAGQLWGRADAVATGGPAPETTSSGWTLLVAKGTAGTTGATGATGPTGPTGTTGTTGANPVSVSWNADGDAYYVAETGRTLTTALERGTGTLVYTKAASATPATFSAASLPITLAAGDVLRLACSSLSGYKAVSLT